MVQGTLLAGQCQCLSGMTKNAAADGTVQNVKTKQPDITNDDVTMVIKLCSMLPRTERGGSRELYWPSPRDAGPAKRSCQLRLAPGQKLLTVARWRTDR